MCILDCLHNLSQDRPQTSKFGGVKPKVRISISPFQEATGVVGAASLVFDNITSIKGSN